MTNFRKWIETFTAEKGISTDTMLTVSGRSGENFIPVGCLIDAMASAPSHEQRGIRDMIVRIDFRNGDVLPYFTHLAQAIAL